MLSSQKSRIKFTFVAPQYNCNFSNQKEFEAYDFMPTRDILGVDFPLHPPINEVH